MKYTIIEYDSSYGHFFAAEDEKGEMIVESIKTTLEGCEEALRAITGSNNRRVVKEIEL